MVYTVGCVIHPLLRGVETPGAQITILRKTESGLPNVHPSVRLGWATLGLMRRGKVGLGQVWLDLVALLMKKNINAHLNHIWQHSIRLRLANPHFAPVL